MKNCFHGYESPMLLQMQSEEFCHWRGIMIIHDYDAETKPIVKLESS